MLESAVSRTSIEIVSPSLSLVSVMSDEAKDNPISLKKSMRIESHLGRLSVRLHQYISQQDSWTDNAAQ